MTHPLTGTWKKVERAYQHINQLDADTKVFVTAKPYGVRTDYDAERGEVVIRFANVPELPLDFSIMIGEALYQMRSALDHLVWQLIVANGKTPPPKSGFPIFTQPNGYAARKNAMIDGLSTAAETRIKALQPYHRGTTFQDDPLWILQDMNNTDKHRLLVLSRAFVAGGGDVEVMSGTLQVDHGALMKVMIQTPIENDAELMRIQPRRAT